MITCVTEYEVVLEPQDILKEREKVTYLPVNELNRIDFNDLESTITEKTVRISIMAANNEIRTINDIATIDKIPHQKDVLFHMDAAQAVWNIPIDVQTMKVDLMSFSAHKMYGPKGRGTVCKVSETLSQAQWNDTWADRKDDYVLAR